MIAAAGGGSAVVRPGSRAAAGSVNCIDCHMPALPSNTITFLVNGQDQPMHDLIRTHLVAIYPDIAKAYLQKIGTGK